MRVRRDGRPWECGRGARENEKAQKRKKMRIKLSKSDWKEIGQKMGWLKTAWEDDEEDRPIIGYWYHGRQHTADETYTDLHSDVLRATRPDAGEDENGIPEEGVVDSEGNFIETLYGRRRSNSADGRRRSNSADRADQEINRERDTYGDYGDMYGDYGRGRHGY